MLASPNEPTIDARAFEAGVTAAVPSMYKFALSLCSDSVRADDLVQETVLRALINRGSFAPGTNLGAWLFTILRNYFRSEWRKRRREVEDVDGVLHGQGPVNGDTSRNTWWADLGVGGADAEEARQDFTKILGLIACLAQEQRDAIVAVGYLGLDYTTAADALDCAIGTVKSRVNRARDSLAQMMREVSEVQFDAIAIVVAARAIPCGHPFHQIATAYEELYGPLVPAGAMMPALSAADEAWRRLVESGAADVDDFDGGFDAQ